MCKNWAQLSFVRVTWRGTDGHVGAVYSSVGALSREVEEVTGQAWSPRLDCAGGGRALESAGVLYKSSVGSCALVRASGAGEGWVDRD